MVKDRLIFTLLMQHGTYMLSRNFRLQSVGDLQWIREYYDINSILYAIDELVVLNVERGVKDVVGFCRNLSELVTNCFMPVAAGGGIKSLEDAALILNAGADKLVINSLLFQDTALVRQLVNRYGSQCIVASIDYLKTKTDTKVYIENGTVDADLDLEATIDHVLKLGVGEIYLNSMKKDGTGQGLDIETIHAIVDRSAVPVIGAGGVGRFDHFVAGIKQGRAKAVATANLFYFMADALSEARTYMKKHHCNMAVWDMADKMAHQLKVNCDAKKRDFYK